LGSDGHVASLFPGMPSLDERDAVVTWSPPGTLPPPVDRVTLTLPVLNAARYVVFLVAGSEKGPVLRRVWEGDEELPAARVRPVDGHVEWFVDAAAMSMAASGVGGRG